MPHPVPKKISRFKAVQGRTGLCRSGIYEAIKAGTFPVPLHISARAIGFLDDEVDAWIAARAAERKS